MMPRRSTVPKNQLRYETCLVSLSSACNPLFVTQHRSQRCNTYRISVPWNTFRLTTSGRYGLLHQCSVRLARSRCERTKSAGRPYDSRFISPTTRKTAENSQTSSLRRSMAFTRIFTESSYVRFSALLTL